MSTPRRQTPTTLAFHASRIVVDVGVLIVMAAMSLSFVSSPSGSRSSLALDALPTVLLLVPIFLITLIPDHTRPIPRILGWFSLVLGLAAFPFSVVKYLDSTVLAGTLEGSVGMGARLLVLGTFATLVGITIGLTRSVMGLETGGAPGRRSAIRTRGDGSTQPDPPTKAGAEAMTVVAPEPAPAVRPGGVVPGAGGALHSTTSSASTPPAHPQPRPRPTPARPMADENPFDSPLFDSIEIPTIVDAEKQTSPTVAAEDAGERPADDDPD